MLLRAAFDAAQRVEDEFAATRFAVEHVAAAWGRDADLTLAAQRAQVTGGQLVRAVAAVDVTFALRSFVQFETVLRDYWASGMGRKSRPDMRPLMDSVARHRQMNSDDLAAAHVVRAYRNSIAHGTAAAAASALPLTVSECQSNLGRYLRWLPQQW